ncbi:MAG: phosphate acyltransferase PlsX [Eubacterium sp.]|nr:phosphate acyltransferase PlsX [Eubacterium sp.]
MDPVVRIAVDAMGGDNAPTQIVKGAVDALNTSRSIEIILVGKEGLIRDELASLNYPEDRLSIVDAPDVIETAEPPVLAIRKKKESSMVVALNMVKHGEADAFVSAGSSGAILVGGQLIVGKAKGVKRAPLAPLIPTEEGVSLLIDCGANVDARAEHLVQFARMGSLYMEYVMGVQNPKVAIVNIGMEEEKGNALVKETYPMLKEAGESGEINFIGSIEAREIPHGYADVVVCEAFVGNVILKLYEGVGTTLISSISYALKSNLTASIGGLLAKGTLKKTLKKFDSSQYGGAPLLGLKGLVVKAHGSSNAVEIKNAILQCVMFTREDINGKIIEAFEA